MTEDTNAPAPRPRIPRYVCHKEVRAFKIGGIAAHEATADKENNGGADLHADGHPNLSVSVGHSYLQKHMPKIGGYYVLYEGGYESFSPAEAFEAGYTELPDFP